MRFSTGNQLRAPSPIAVSSTLLLVLWSVFGFSRTQLFSGPVIAGVAACLLLVTFMFGLRGPQLSAIWWPLVILMILSTFRTNWEIESLYGTSLAILTILSGGYAARFLTPERFLRVFDLAMRVLLVLSLLIALVLPEIGVTQEGPTTGSLRGLFPHRNHLAYMAAIGLLTMLWQGRGRGKNWATLFWSGIYIATTFLTGSSTGIVLIASGLVIWICLCGLERIQKGIAKILLVAFILLLPAIGVMLQGLAGGLASLLGRDLSFTGRDSIWNGAIAAAKLEPWFGYGWGMILNENSPAWQIMRAYAGWNVTSTHNGYVATILQLGILGFAATLLILGVLLLRSLNSFISTGLSIWGWSVQIILLILTVDFVETRAFAGVGLFLLALISGWRLEPPNSAPKVPLLQEPTQTSNSNSKKPQKIRETEEDNVNSRQ